MARHKKYCKRCGRTVAEYACARCKQGNCCGCDCNNCGNCGKTVGSGHFCNVCRLCKHKPKAPNMIEQVCSCRHKPALKHFSVNSTYVFNPLRRLLGTEIECGEWGGFDKNILANARFFSGHFTRDGSVRPSAQELVLNPMAGDQFLRGMNELAYTLCEHGATVNQTCGFHVHVDGTDLNYFALRNLIHLYSAIESSVFELVVQRERFNNEHYCVPFNHHFKDVTKRLADCKTTHEIKETILRRFYGMNFPKSLLAHNMDLQTFASAKRSTVRQWRERTGNKYPPDAFRAVRYNALNLHSWFYRGTIEFRMFEGTTNLHDLVFWPLFCGWMVELAYTKPYKEIQEIANMYDFLKQVPAPIKTWAVTRMRNNELGEIL